MVLAIIVRIDLHVPLGVIKLVFEDFSVHDILVLIDEGPHTA